MADYKLWNALKDAKKYRCRFAMQRPQWPLL